MRHGPARRIDPALIVAQDRSIGALSDTVTRLAGFDAAPSAAPDLALIGWALAHGLVVLARDGALQAAAGADQDDFDYPATSSACSQVA